MFISSIQKDGSSVLRYYYFSTSHDDLHERMWKEKKPIIFPSWFTKKKIEHRLEWEVPGACIISSFPSFVERLANIQFPCIVIHSFMDENERHLTVPLWTEREIIFCVIFTVRTFRVLISARKNNALKKRKTNRALFYVFCIRPPCSKQSKSFMERMWGLVKPLNESSKWGPVIRYIFTSNAIIVRTQIDFCFFDRALPHAFGSNYSGKKELSLEPKKNAFIVLNYHWMNLKINLEFIQWNGKANCAHRTCTMYIFIERRAECDLAFLKDDVKFSDGHQPRTVFIHER